VVELAPLVEFPKSGTWRFRADGMVACCMFMVNVAYTEWPRSGFERELDRRMLVSSLNGPTANMKGA
jgi:hypothetical protein